MGFFFPLLADTFEKDVGVVGELSVGIALILHVVPLSDLRFSWLAVPQVSTHLHKLFKYDHK